MITFIKHSGRGKTLWSENRSLVAVRAGVDKGTDSKRSL